MRRPRSLGAVAGADGSAPQRRRGRVAGLLGEPAQPRTPQPVRERAEVPSAVRRAALIVALEAVLVAAVALMLLYLTVTSTPDSVRRALAEVVYVGLAASLLGAAAAGLWRMSAWVRGPVVFLQLLLAVLGYTLAFQVQRPALGIPVLVLVAVELYLLVTPQARAAFNRR